MRRSIIGLGLVVSFLFSSGVASAGPLDWFKRRIFGSDPVAQEKAVPVRHQVPSPSKAKAPVAARRPAPRAVVPKHEAQLRAAERVAREEEAKLKRMEKQIAHEAAVARQQYKQERRKFNKEAAQLDEQTKLMNQAFEGFSFCHVDDAEVEAEMKALFGDGYQRNSSHLTEEEIEAEIRELFGSAYRR
jgi:hypothetical protein